MSRILAVVVLLIVGFFAGRASNRVDPGKLRDSLATYRAGMQQARAERDSLVEAIIAFRLQADSAEQRERQARARAALSAQNAIAAGRRADSLWAMLAMARTPADSNAILLPACLARAQECADLRRANGDLLTAVAQADTAKTALRGEIAAHQRTRNSDSTRLAQADRLINQLERAAGGCRVPLLDLKCPAFSATWDLDGLELAPRYFSATYPLRSWLHAGVTYDRKRNTP